MLMLGNKAGAEVEILDYNSFKNIEHIGFVKSNSCNTQRFVSN